MSYGHLENAKIALESVDPTGLQIREELKSAKVVAAEKQEAEPKVQPENRVHSATSADATVPPADDSKKW